MASLPRHDQTESLNKVTLLLDEQAWHGHRSESVWAQPRGKCFELRSVPFYARGISYGDAVRVESQGAENIVKEIVGRSGHSTYRIFLTDSHLENFKRDWSTLACLGCTHERATERLFAIDVPPSADIFAVYRALEEGKQRGIWDFEEGHCAHVS